MILIDGCDMGLTTPLSGEIVGICCLIDAIILVGHRRTGVIISQPGNGENFVSIIIKAGTKLML